MPWVECTPLRYHCTKIPDVDLCPEGFADGRFPPGCTAADFIRIDQSEMQVTQPSLSSDAQQPAIIPGRSADMALLPSGSRQTQRPCIVRMQAAGDSVWTDQDTLLLLEGLELFGDNWAEVADHVGTKSQVGLLCTQRARPLSASLPAHSH